ncbi:hypothetical protein PVAP13_9KG393608 [Panicum virgatum]|uniref:Uncharacterized protein n=1 Tax=Panicum virgatum TaxID=38727 RepID=A0A8T0N6W5_PANVG|nr:hypothetical protein PVAP13_9KG393608 [Panicum virgatum]
MRALSQVAKLWAPPGLLATVQKEKKQKQQLCIICGKAGLRRRKPRAFSLMTAISGHVGRGPDLLRRRTPRPNGPCNDTTPPCSSSKKKKKVKGSV